MFPSSLQCNAYLKQAWNGLNIRRFLVIFLLIGILGLNVSQGTHAYITDVEELMLEHEIGLSSDSLPLEDLFLESKPTQGYYYRGDTPFEVFDSPHFSGAVLSHSNTDTVDKMLLDTDSEDGYDLVDTNELTAHEKTASGEISIDMDEINESEIQELTYSRTVGFLASGGELYFIATGQSRCFEIRGSFFPEPAIPIYLGPEEEIARELYLYLYTLRSALTDYDAPQVKLGNLQEKDYEQHMAHPPHWRIQVTASQDPLVVGSATSTPDLKHLTRPSIPYETPLLDIDKNSESDDSVGLLEHDEIKITIPELVYAHEPSLHALRQDDFLNLSSDELWSDKEIDMDYHQNCDSLSRSDRLHYVDDEDMITDSSILEVLGDEDSNLHTVESRQRCSGVASYVHAGREDVVHYDDEMQFVELVT